MAEERLADRSRERLAEHYEIERELADRLRHATREERKALYSAVYDELFQRVPDHPQLTKKGQAMRDEEVRFELSMLEPYLGPDRVALEIGAGDGALSRALAARCRSVFALDVSAEILSAADLPANAERVLSDGLTVPVPAGSVDVAYSNQVMEHLHPDDAVPQLAAIRAALAPGGVYVCQTPNRMSGPHDISGFFSDVPRGFHLHEYTNGELRSIFHAAGFAKVELWAVKKGRRFRLPWPAVAAAEAFLARLPWRRRRSLARQLPLRVLVSGYVVGRVAGGA
jgi:SAM-dependent methyltransferase